MAEDDTTIQWFSNKLCVGFWHVPSNSVYKLNYAESHRTKGHNCPWRCFLPDSNKMFVGLELFLLHSSTYLRISMKWLRVFGENSLENDIQHALQLKKNGSKSVISSLGTFLCSTGIQCMVNRNGRDRRDKDITDYHRPSRPTVYCKHTRHPNACTR